MSIIDRFLNELNNRVQAVSADVSDINSQRNKVLEIENILFNKGIDKNNFNAEDLIKLDTEEYGRILNAVRNESNASKLGSFQSFLAHKSIIELYKKLSVTHGENSISDANQYKEALNSLSNVVAEVSEFIQTYSSEKTNKDASSIDTVDVFKSYVGMFRAGELVTPIFDWDKFNRVVNLCGLTPIERAELKKQVGQANIKLVMIPHLLKEETDSLNKYRQIYNRKYKKIKKYIESVSIFISNNDITEINENNADEVINLIAKENSNIAFRNVQNTVISLLMASELGKADAFIAEGHGIDEIKAFVSLTINHLDSILALSKIEQLIEDTYQEIIPEVAEVTLAREFEGTKTINEALAPGELIDNGTDAFIGMNDLPDELPVVGSFEISENLEEADVVTPADTKPLSEEVRPVEVAIIAESAFESPEEIIEEVPISAESKALIDQINKILNEEDGFLKSVDPDVYTRYSNSLAIVNRDENEEDTEKHRLVVIIETLRQELNAFKIVAVKYAESADEFANNYNSKKGKIKDYIEVYEVLKSRNKTTEEKEKPNNLLYLANANNSALMLYYLDDFDNEKKSQLKKLLDELAEKDPKTAKTIFEVDNNEVLSSGKKNVSVAYIKINENLKLILLAYGKTKKAEEEAKMVISHYQTDINQILERAASKELTLLIDEQASVREAIANYFGEIVDMKK